jgi:hypothetical protein
MTLLTADRELGDLASVVSDVPEISAAAAGMRAAASRPAVAAPAAAAASPAETSPLAGPEDSAPPAATVLEPSRRGRRQRRPKAPAQDRPVKTVLVTSVLVLALAVVAVAAGYLTFPHAAVFGRLQGHLALTLAPAAALGAIISAMAAWNAARRLLQGRKSADVLTVLAATVATVVSGTGMWAFFAAYVPTIPVLIRIPIFAFLELATLAEALRARDNMRQAAEHAARGDGEASGMDIDALAMWVLTSISAFLASLASTTIAEAIFRLAPPLVAAWLWERALVSERRRIRPAQGDKTTWRISPQRILARIGLIDPAGKTIGETAALRRITELALAAENVSALDAAGIDPSDRRRVRADRHLRRALRLAVDQAELASNHARQRALVDQIRILRSPQDLVTLDAESPWAALAGGRRNQDQDQDDDQDRKQDDEQQDDDQDRKQDQDQRGSSTTLSELANAVTQAMRQGNGEQVHELLAARSDYAGLVHWAARNGGTKRLMAAAALYAVDGAIASPTWGARWISQIVPGKQGEVDKAEFRRVRELIGPVWSARNYTGPAAAGGGKD